MRVLFAAQTGVAPPTFVLFTNVAAKLHFSYERYLTNRLREEYGFAGTPIRLHVRRRARGPKGRRRRADRRAILHTSAGCRVGTAERRVWPLRNSSASRPRTSARSLRCSRMCCAPGRRSSRTLANTAGGPRIYGRADVERVLRIRELVYVEGLTLAGARRRLEETAGDTARRRSRNSARRRADPDAAARVRQGLQGVLALLERPLGGAPFELVAAAPDDRRRRAPKGARTAKRRRTVHDQRDVAQPG